MNRAQHTCEPGGWAQSWALQIVCGPAQGACPRGKAPRRDRPQVMQTLSRSMDITLRDRVYLGCTGDYFTIGR